MKKVALSIIVAGMFAFVACGPKGPTAEELAKIAADSITADSTAKAAVADSLAKVAVADSLKAAAVADSIAKAAVAPKKKGK